MHKEARQLQACTSNDGRGAAAVDAVAHLAPACGLFGTDRELLMIIVAPAVELLADDAAACTVK